jgi:hypothetical protein
MYYCLSAVPGQYTHTHTYSYSYLQTLCKLKYKYANENLQTCWIKSNKLQNHMQSISIVWFNANLISLNWKKTHFMHFTTKNNLFTTFDIIYKDKKLTKVYSIKFLGLTLDNLLLWKKHIEAIVPKLSAATFAMRIVQPFLSLDSLKLIYYSYFHSILTYGIIFWGNTPHSNVIFRMQKRIVRIMVGVRNSDSCREYFKRLKILPLQSQYSILWLKMLTILD